MQFKSSGPGLPKMPRMWFNWWRDIQSKEGWIPKKNNFSVKPNLLNYQMKIMTRWHQPGPGSAFRERSAYGQTNITVGISFVWSVVQFHVGWHQDFNLKPRYDFGRQGRQNLFSWVCSCTYKRIWTSQTFDFERLYLHLICWLAIGDMIWKMIYQLFCIWGDCYGISAKGIVKNFVLTCWRASPPRYNQRSIYQLTGKEKS